MLIGLNLPGYQNSPPGHWQSIWEELEPALGRVQQISWDKPRAADWLEAIEAAVAAAGPQVVLVAHSLGCLALAHWASRPHSPVRGALLVAPPDPESAAFPATAQGFAPLPLHPLGFPAHLMASRNDEYASFEFAQSLAQNWECELHDLGERGHLNLASQLGKFDEAWVIFRRLCAAPA